MPSLRLVFAGSPAAAVPSLEALIASEHEVVAVVTREDSPQGRKGLLTPTPVADAAGEIEVIKANRLAGAATDRVAELAPDLGVIVAYGGLVREPLLSAPRLGWINLHFSLLPRWRGAAPVQRAIMAGDEVTGAAVFQLVAELDAGDVYGQITEPIGRHQTAGSLLEQLSASGAQLLTRVVDELAIGSAVGVPQVGEVTLAPKLTLPDGRIDFTQPAEAVASQIRGVTPEPGAFTSIDGARLKVLDAHVAREAPRVQAGHFALEGRRLLLGTASDPIELVTVLPAGKKAMAAADWWRGRPADAGVIAE
jgi:methionyl-tRNA formyltransferase